MITKAKRLAVVGLAALLLAGGGIDAQAQGRERPGEEIPSEREEGPRTQAGSGNINSGGECCDDPVPQDA